MIRKKIYRRFIIVIFLAFAALSMRAEDHYIPHISVGVHAGGTASRVSFSPSVLQSWQPGMIGGLSIRYAEEKLVGVLAEVNVEQRGWKENFEVPQLSYSRTLTYMSVPVMTHVYFGPPRFKCFFNLGPEFSFLLGQTTSANFDYTHPYESEFWPTKKRMTEQMTTQVSNTFDYGIVAGFGCEYWIRPRHSAYFEIRYYFGLGNIFPAAKADTFSASRNTNLALTLGYNFRLM